MSTIGNTSRPVVVGTAGSWLIWHPELDKQQHWSGLDTQQIADQAGHRLTIGHQRGWVIGAATGRPESIQWNRRRRIPVTTATLKNPALNTADPERWPLEVPAAHLKRWEEDDGIYNADDYDQPVEYVDEQVVLDLSDAIQIDADTDLPEQVWLNRWSVDWQHQILHQAQIHPWLPGHLSGFRAHMATLLLERAEVSEVWCKGIIDRSRDGRAHDYEGSDGPHFNVRLMWSDGRTAARTPKGRRKPVTSRTWVTEQISLRPVPMSIDGDNLWDAMARWEQTTAEWLASWDLIGAEACAHCDGRGWIRSDMAEEAQP